MEPSAASKFAWSRYGQHGVLLEFDSPESTLQAYRACRGGPFDECVPGARTLYVEAGGRSAPELSNIVAQLLEDPPSAADDASIRTHIFEVRYDGEDLDNVATLTGLSVEEVIRRHSQVVYTVAFLGFSRSFPYLAGLDPSIVVPRLPVPRTSVPAGSVAMGAGYTGIYPMSSPGGWQLLGRTDAVMFDPANDPPSALATGDFVRFARV